MNKTLTISKFAQAGGVSVEAVRFYQRKGLLGIPSAPSGVRLYGDEELRHLKFIKKAQAAGFTLEEIKELIQLDSSQDRARANEMAQARLAALNQKITELEQARDALNQLTTQCCHTSTGPCPILAAFGV